MMSKQGLNNALGFWVELDTISVHKIQPSEIILFTFSKRVCNEKWYKSGTMKNASWVPVALNALGHYDPKSLLHCLWYLVSLTIWSYITL